MSLALVTAPPAMPLSVEEVLAHSRISISTELGQIQQWIAAATDRVETYLQRRLITQTWDWRFDAFAGELELPWSPVQSVDTVEYVDTAGATQTLSSALYQTDLHSAPARLAPAYGTTWPSTRAQYNAVRVRFTVGYGATGIAIPKAVRAALLMLLDDLYERRSAVTERGTFAGGGVDQNPALIALLWPYRSPNGAW